jgi:hypothetical protein
MRRDSDIAEAVMLNLIDQGIAPLPVHDSFIVPAGQAGQLEEAMQKVLARKTSLPDDSYIDGFRLTRKSVSQYGEGGVGTGEWERVVVDLPGYLWEWRMVIGT